jgi:hypothetical protein
MQKATHVYADNIANATTWTRVKTFRVADPMYVYAHTYVHMCVGLVGCAHLATAKAASKNIPTHVHAQNAHIPGGMNYARRTQA